MNLNYIKITKFLIKILKNYHILVFDIKIYKINDVGKRKVVESLYNV